MKNNLIEVDFKKNKGKQKNKSFFDSIKDFFKRLFSSKDSLSENNAKNKNNVVNYSRDIS